MRHYDFTDPRDGTHHVVTRVPGTTEGVYTSVMECPTRAIAKTEAKRLNAAQPAEQRLELADRKLLDRRST